MIFSGRYDGRRISNLLRINCTYAGSDSTRLRTMIPNEEFDELITRIRAGDPAAATELVQQFEPQIRREIRLRLTDRQLRQTLDSIDISQSIFGNFFVRATLGEFDFDRPEQLLGLLATMARNKVIDHHRRLKTQKNTLEVARKKKNNEQTTASSIIAGKELVEEFQSRMSEEEKIIAGLRKDGRTWAEIGNQLHEKPEALRKRLSRACDRIMLELEI